MNEMIILKQIVFSLLLVIPTMSNSYAQNNSNIKTDDVSIVKMANYGCDQRQTCCWQEEKSDHANIFKNNDSNRDVIKYKDKTDNVIVNNEILIIEQKFICWDTENEAPNLCPVCDEKIQNVEIKRNSEGKG